MKCHKIQRLLSDGASGDAQRQAVAEHLEQCSGCRRFESQLEALTSGFVSLLPVPEPRPGFAGRTLARIPADEPQASWRERVLEILQPTPTALATASLALGIFLALGMNGAAREAQATDAHSALFAEFFDVPPFDSIDQGVSPAPTEPEP